MEVVEFNTIDYLITQINTEMILRNFQLLHLYNQILLWKLFFPHSFVMFNGSKTLLHAYVWRIIIFKPSFSQLGCEECSTFWNRNSSGFLLFVLFFVLFCFQTLFWSSIKLKNLIHLFYVIVWYFPFFFDLFHYFFIFFHFTFIFVQWNVSFHFLWFLMRGKKIPILLHSFFHFISFFLSLILSFPFPSPFHHETKKNWSEMKWKELP
jgi:hypothetical protein